MSVWELYLNNGKSTLAETIEFHLTSEDFLKSFASRSDCEDLYNQIREMQLFTIDISEFREIIPLSFNSLTLPLETVGKEFVKDRRRMSRSSLPFKERFRRSLVFNLIGITICLKYPFESMMEDILGIVWRKHCCPLIGEMVNLRMSFPPDLPPSASDVLKLVDEFLNRLSILYFYAVLYFSKAVPMTSNDREKRYIMYFISFFLYVVGEVINHLKITSKPGLASEFFTLATKVWPRYSRPYYSLGSIYAHKAMLFEAIYYYSRSFLSLTSEDRFSVAREDLSSIYVRVTEQYERCSDHLRNFKFADILNRSQISNCQIFLFKKRQKPYLILIKNNERPYLITNHSFFVIKMPNPMSKKFKVEYYKALFDVYVYGFLFMNLQTWYKYSLENFDEILDFWVLVFGTLKLFDEFYSPYIFERLSSFSLILIYSLEVAMRDKSSSVSREASLLSLRCVFKFIFAFSAQVFDFFSRPSFNDSLLIPVLKCLVLIVHSLKIAFLEIDLREIIPTCVLRGDFLFISELYNWLSTQVFETSSENDIYELKMLTNSSFKIDPHADCWNIFTFYETPCSKESYYSYMRQCLKKIIKKQCSCYGIFEGVCKFNADYLSLLLDQNDPKESDFTRLLSTVGDQRLTIWLFNHLVNYCRPSDSIIHVIQQIVPDTNAFLVNKNSIVISNLFASMDIAVPILVVRELMGINEGKYQKYSDDIIRRAGEAFQFIKPMITKRTNVKVLAIKGDLTVVTENVCEYHDANQKYDDLIHDSLIALNDKLLKSITFHNKKFTIKPLLFITNDILLQTKTRNSEIACMTSKAFKRITRLLEL